MAKERLKREGVQLCYPTEPGRIKRLGDVFAVQPKINGERAIVEWFGGAPVLISSYGNEFKFLDHIQAQIQPLYKEYGPIPLDGEIYRHGWSRERIDSALRRTVNRSPDVEGLEYHVFDLRTPEPCIERLNTLHYMYNKEPVLEPPLDLVPHYSASEEDWLTLATIFVDLGYEGAILRRLDAPWQAKRTVNMLKFKPTSEDHYEILEVNEAIDKEGNPKSMVGSFTVKAPDVAETFKVGAGKMSHERRTELWRYRALLPGIFLVVKHEPIRTSGGVPLCSVAVDLLPEDSDSKTSMTTW